MYAKTFLYSWMERFLFIPPLDEVSNLVINFPAHTERHFSNALRNQAREEIFISRPTSIADARDGNERNAFSRARLSWA